VRKMKIVLCGPGGRKAIIGDHTMEPHKPRIGVVAPKRVASVMKHNAKTRNTTMGSLALRSLSATTIDIE
jgi:hypothetical protein